MTESAPIDGLSSQLADLERCLLTPVVSGELATWCETVRRSFHQAKPAIRKLLNEAHPQELEQILQEDPELSHEIEKLWASASELNARLDMLGGDLEMLPDVAEVNEPNERPIQSVAERISKSGIELVIAIRRQEEAVKTWRHEALARDRGPVD